MSVRTVPFNLAHPVWVDDRHFTMEDHVRYTAVPPPGGPAELHALASRLLGGRLDLTRSPWQVWLAEGLPDGRWALISKVHHCMVDGLAGINLLTVLLDLTPRWAPAEPRVWMPDPEPSIGAVLRDGVLDGLKDFRRQATRLFLPAPRDSVATAKAVPAYAARLMGSGAPELNGPTVPARRWSRACARMDEVDRIRRAFGGSVNDVALAAATSGFRDLLAARGALAPGTVVRALVPVSVRSPGERGILANRVSALLCDLPCGEDDPLRRLRIVRDQMDGLKNSGQAAGLDSFVKLRRRGPAASSARRRRATSAAGGTARHR